MRISTILWLCLGAGCLCLLAGCGMLDTFLGKSGVPGAGTSASQEAAHQADWSIWNYLGQLFGVSPMTPQGPPQAAHDGAILLVGVGAKKIVKGVTHVAKAAGAGVAHAARTVRGTKQPGNPG